MKVDWHWGGVRLSQGAAMRTGQLVAFVSLLLVCGADASARPVEIRSSPVAGQIARGIEDALSGFPGNKTDASWTSLSIDDKTGLLQGRLKLTLGHYWGEVANQSVSVTASGSLEFRYDPLNEDLDLQATIDLGERCVPGWARAWVSPDCYSLSATLSLSQIEALLEGDLAALLELIPNPAPGLYRVDHENDYTAVREWYEKKHGKQNIYFVRPDFVDWASPERLIHWAGALVLTGGAAFELILKEVKAKLRPELRSMQDWLAERGLAEAQQIALGIVQGRPPTSTPTLHLRFAPVQYRTRHIAFGRRQVGSARWNHAALVLIFGGAGGSPNPTASAPLTIEPPATGDSEPAPTYFFGAKVAQYDLSARVVAVKPGSPAARAGLLEDDRITVWNGRSIGRASAGHYELEPLISTSANGRARVRLVRKVGDIWVEKNLDAQLTRIQ